MPEGEKKNTRKTKRKLITKKDYGGKKVDSKTEVKQKSVIRKSKNKPSRQVRRTQR